MVGLRKNKSKEVEKKSKKKKSKGPNYNLLTGGVNPTIEEEKIKLNSFWNDEGYTPPNDADNFLLALLRMADSKSVLPICYPMSGSEDIDEAIDNADYSIELLDSIEPSSIVEVKDIDNED
jgi:hypothetical protein